MKYILDSHTHTLVSGHAFCTIREMSAAARRKNLSLLAITEHCVNMPGSCHEYYFENYRILDRNAYDVPLLFGVELNILDEKGSVDMTPQLLSFMDVAIASLHPPCVRFMSRKETTDCIIHILENPLIQIVGHLDDDRFPVNYDEVARAAAANHKLFEINNSSLASTSFRPGAHDNYLRLLESCMKHDVEIILNSDAHVDTDVGRHDEALQLLEELNLPERLVVNRSVEELKRYVNCGRK